MGGGEGGGGRGRGLLDLCPLCRPPLPLRAQGEATRLAASRESERAGEEIRGICRAFVRVSRRDVSGSRPTFCAPMDPVGSGGCRNRDQGQFVKDVFRGGWVGWGARRVGGRGGEGWGGVGDGGSCTNRSSLSRVAFLAMRASHFLTPPPPLSPSPLTPAFISVSVYFGGLLCCYFAVPMGFFPPWEIRVLFARGKPAETELRNPILIY